jgi:ABC-type uncharacterized transport system substrate-binding protein
MPRISEREEPIMRIGDLGGPARKIPLLVVMLLALVLACPSSGASKRVGDITPTRSDTAIRTKPLAGSHHERLRVLHLMSYHSPWEWTDDLMKGFKDQLTGLDIEYRSFQMDTKRNSSEGWKLEAAREAMKIIDTWKPDLVYATDEIAQKYVVKHYVNTRTPFVFSEVNADPREYGYPGSSNITGVLERAHFVQTIKLLREIVPGVKRIAIIVDEDPTWSGVIERMKEKASTMLPDLELVGWDLIHSFDEYKSKILQYQNSVDALGLLGIHTFKDERGKNVPWQEVLRWTTENSRLPDFSFWKDRITCGTLCAVYVSGYEQGRAAWKIARGILEEGRSPSSFPMLPTLKGEPIVSLARARKLGIRLTSQILLTAKIVKEFAWSPHGGN